MVPPVETPAFPAARTLMRRGSTCPIAGPETAAAIAVLTYLRRVERTMSFSVATTSASGDHEWIVIA